MSQTFRTTAVQKTLMKNQNHSGKTVDITFLPASYFKGLLNLFLLLFLYTVSYGQKISAKNHSAAPSGLDASLEKKVRNTLKQNSQKLQLVENNGQSGLSKNVVAYFSSANETVFIEKDRLRIVIAESADDNSGKKKSGDKIGITELANKKSYRYNSFSIQFKGSKGFTELEKVNPYVTKRNFVNTQSINNNTVTAGCYAEITLKNIYAGIDLRLYSQEDGHLEFDWIVWPGYDASKIKMEFAGQKNLKITAAGNLQVGLGLGNFNMRLPESYYVTPTGKQPVNAKFSMARKNEIHFKGFDKNFKKYPLVIDPDLLWGTFFDGGNTNFDEYLYAIEFNYNNNLIYCAGAASLQVSTTYAAALSSAYDSTFAATPDGLIYALTKNGELITNITYLGGADDDVAIGLALSDSFVYICGYTASLDFPVTKLADGNFPAFDSVYHGNIDGFIAIMNLDLDSLKYCSYLGGDGKDKALTVRAITDSSFYVSLSTTDTLPVIAPNYVVNFADDVLDGNSEAWIGKFTSFNSLNFGTYVGGDNDDLINDFQVLSTGDIVFTGNTKNITEVNASIPNNASGQEALFGRINVPVSGPVVFDIIDKIGGSNNDYGWGIYSLGDSVSIVVGQTNSSNFPLGTGPVFQNTRSGSYDGFIAKIYNDGSPGYKATFTGGSDDEILVSVRPVTVNNQVALLSFGTTASNDLVTRNFNSGTFFSDNNSGGLDMVFVICDMNLVSKYYLSYIGGSANDYLGITGAPVASNHLFYNSVDSVLYLGTTTHSSQTTHAPLFVGRGPADYVNTGVPVFDETKGNSNNDTHVIVAISTRGLFMILPLKWLNFETKILSDCSAQLSWTTANEDNIFQYIIERSTDGRNFKAIDSLSPDKSNKYFYTDRNFAEANGRVYYRIVAKDIFTKASYSSVQLVYLCGNQQSSINIYPTLVQNSFTISGLRPDQTQNMVIDLVDAAGQKIVTEQMPYIFGSYTVYLKNKLVPGTYFIILKNNKTGIVNLTRKIIVSN